MKRIVATCALVFTALAGACPSPPDCSLDSECAIDEQCGDDGACAPIPDGTNDAGTPNDDAGTPTDDAGTPTDDAGTPDDAGVPTTVAITAFDADAAVVADGDSVTLSWTCLLYTSDAADE